MVWLEWSIIYRRDIKKILIKLVEKRKTGNSRFPDTDIVAQKTISIYPWTTWSGLRRRISSLQTKMVRNYKRTIEESSKINMLCKEMSRGQYTIEDAELLYVVQNAKKKSENPHKW